MESASGVSTPPPEATQTSPLYKKILIVVAAPVGIIFTLLWASLGFLFTLPAGVVAVIGIALTWVFYLWHTSALLLEMPLALTVALLLDLVMPHNRLLHLSVWVVVSEFAVARSRLLDFMAAQTAIIAVSAPIEAQPATPVYYFILLSCFLPAWLSFCSLGIWLPANEVALESAERSLYRSVLQTDFTLDKVSGLGSVHVPYCGKNTGDFVPQTLVLVHGYFAGNAFWAANLQGLAESFDVHIVEWKGIGRSIRPKFKPRDDHEADEFFVESLEHWRKAMGIEQFILCGHSMGGMFSTYYTYRYGKHIEHLILVSPAGVNASQYTHDQLPLVRRIAYKFHLTPMTIVRIAGPLGPHLVQWAVRKRSSWTPPTNAIRSGRLDIKLFAEYCYHNWALKASGEIALHTHLHPGACARRTPLNELLVPDRWNVPVTFLYGDTADWMDHTHGAAVVEKLAATQYAALHHVPLSGHQVFMDNPTEFNRILIQAIQDQIHFNLYDNRK